MFQVVILFLAFLVALFGPLVAVAQVPHESARYRGDLTRNARMVWGLDAPVATFAAQIHQESGWNPAAVSRVGARGMAQFMPATATWWCRAHNLADCAPENPAWAMRALVGYDRWLFDRVQGRGECDRMWGALRSYNGGLGHWRNEARLAADPLERGAVDSACGRASRSIKHCAENLGYPRRIVDVLQPRYSGWGRGVCA